MKQITIDMDWELGTSCFRLNGSNKCLSKRNPFWQKTIPTQKGDQVEIHPDIPILFPLPERATFGMFFSILQTGLNTRLIHKDEKKIARKQIQKFYDLPLRTKMYTDLQANELTPFDIMGDNAFWGGSLFRTKDGIWHYTTDS